MWARANYRPMPGVTLLLHVTRNTSWTSAATMDTCILDVYSCWLSVTPERARVLTDGWQQHPCSPAPYARDTARWQCLTLSHVAVCGGTRRSALRFTAPQSFRFITKPLDLCKLRSFRWRKSSSSLLKDIFVFQTVSPHALLCLHLTTVAS